MLSRSHLENFTEQDAKKSWELLEGAIAKIYEKKSSELSYEELYRTAYYLVLHKYGDFTYQNLQQSIRHHLQNYSLKLLHSQEEAFLGLFNEIWLDAKEMVKIITQIFLYMDKNHVTKEFLNPVKIVGYQIFLQVFLEDQTFYRKFEQQVLGLIRNEREGLQADRTLLKNLLSMLVLYNLFSYY